MEKLIIYSLVIVVAGLILTGIARIFKKFKDTGLIFLVIFLVIGAVSLLITEIENLNLKPDFEKIYDGFYNIIWQLL